MPPPYSDGLLVLRYGLRVAASPGETRSAAIFMRVTLLLALMLFVEVPHVNDVATAVFALG